MSLVPAQNNEQLQTYLEKHKIDTLYKDATERPIARKIDFDLSKRYQNAHRLGLYSVTRQQI